MKFEMKYNEYIKKDYVYGVLMAKVLRVVYKQDTSVICPRKGHAKYYLKIFDFGSLLE